MLVSGVILAVATPARQAGGVSAATPDVANQRVVKYATRTEESFMGRRYDGTIRCARFMSAQCWRRKSASDSAEFHLLTFVTMSVSEWTKPHSSSPPCLLFRKHY